MRGAAGALAGLLAITSAAAQAPSPAPNASWLAERLTSGFASATGGTMTIGAIDVAWTSLTATVRDVTLAIPAGEGAPPMTASIGSARIKLAWSGLAGVAGGQIHLTSVVAEGVTFSCSREWIETWRPRPSTGERHPVEIRVDHLEALGSAVEYLDILHHVAIRARDVSYSGDWSTSRRLVVGRAEGSVTVEAPLFDRPWPASVRAGVRIGAGRVEIVSAEGTGPGATADLSGTVTWGAGASFTAEGRGALDFAALGPFLPGHLGLAGRAEGPFGIVFSGGAPLRLTVRAASSGFKVGPVVTDTATAELTVRPGRLDVSSIDARAYGGSFTGTVGLTFGKEPRLTTHLIGRGADLGKITALSGKELPLAASADLTFDLDGNPAHPAGWTGEAVFQASPRTATAPRRVPVGGRGRLSFADGGVRLSADRLEAGDGLFAVEFGATLEEKPPPIRFAIEGETRDAAATQRATLLLLDALGVPRNRFVEDPVTGRGRIRASVHAGAATSLDLALELSDGSWMGEAFDRAHVDLAVDARAVELRKVEAWRGPESLEGSLRYDLVAGALDALDVHLRDARLGPRLARIASVGGIDGRLDLDLTGDRSGGTLAAMGTLAARGVLVGHEIVDELGATVRLEGKTLVLDAIEARGEALRFRGRVIYDVDSGQGSVEAAPVGLDLAASRTLADAGLNVLGSVEARGTVAFDRSGPSGTLSLGASGVLIDTGHAGIREVTLGDLTGAAQVSTRGVELSFRALPQSAWTFDAFLGWEPALPLSAVLYFDDLRIGAAGAFGESADVRVKGQVHAEGELAHPREMEIDGVFDEVALRLGPRVLRSAAPFSARLESGRFALGPGVFEGEGTHLELRAGGSLAGEGIEGRVAGTVDLGAVSAFWRELRGAGTLALDVSLAGTADAPELRGEVAVHGGQLRLIGAPQSLDQVEARAVLTGKTIELSSLRAFQGGGEITASGRMILSGLLPSSFHADVSAANVSADYPAGFKGLYEGRLAIDGTPKGATVSGRVNLVRGLYGRSFEAGGLGGASRREFAGAEESPVPRNIFLDIDLVAPGNVWVRNEVAKLEASGEIHVGGELARPEVTGRIAVVPGGTIRYRNVDYLLDYGTADLTDRKRINPYVDVRGHTRVGDYEISLHVEGTIDHFEYELTSTPPLSSQDIISVLVTGKTLESASAASTASGLPADMAAYYFAGLLSSTWGATVQQSLGIDQLELTPTLLRGQADPTARVTIGKRVSDDVKIVFSQDIGSAQRQTYQVVWDASRRVRVIAESDTDTGLGGEVQYSRQFGGTPVGRIARPAGGAVDDAFLPGKIASVIVLTDTGVPRPELLKVAKIAVGDPFYRGTTLAAAERVREALLKSGFLEASVRPEIVRDDAAGSYAVTLRLVEGPKIEIEITTVDGGGRRALRKTLAAFWRDTTYTIDYWDEAAQALVQQSNGAGYYAADVTWSARSTPAGRTVDFRVDRGKPVRLRAVRFHGVQALGIARVEAQVSSMQAPALKKRLLRPAVLSEDLAAVRALYRDEGYARVRVGSPRIALSATGDAAEVDVDIEEGPRFTVDALSFSEGLPAPEATLRGWIPLKPGGVFSPRLLAESEQVLRERLDRMGYPEATVESRVSLLTATADVAFDVAPGGAKRIAEVAIEGNKVTKKRTIANALTFGDGDVLSRDELLKSQQRLYRTGLFSGVKMTYASLDPEAPERQRVAVRVEEAPPLSLGLGVGYESQDGPRASFLLGYSNVGGVGLGTALQGLVSKNDQRAQLTFHRRIAFGRFSDWLASIFVEKALQTGFTERSRSLSFRFEQRPKPRWIRFIRYAIQEVRISDITDSDQTLEQVFQDKLSAIRLGSLGVGFVRDSRDDPFTPTRGTYGSIETSVFAPFLASEASFAKLFLRGSYAKTLKRGIRFTTFLRIGLEQPFGATDLVPLSERFFAGGSNTLRGFATDSVGGLQLQVCIQQPCVPPTAANTQTFNAGGQALLLLNEEFTIPLWKSLRGETFLDVGNVYPTIGDFRVRDVRSSAGLGLRIETPIGPIRVEYGWKLDRMDDESPGGWVIAIGSLF